MNIAEHYQVALQVGPHFGSISYQIPTKEFSVFFPLPEYKEKVEAYLSKPQTVHQAINIQEFKSVEVDPLSSLENFKTALTDLYNHTGVRVDWSVHDEKIPSNELPAK